MRKVIGWAVGLAALVGLLGAWASQGVADSSRQPSPGGLVAKTLEVTVDEEQASVFTVVDLGEAGFGPGDQVVENAPVVDGAGSTIGTSFTTITVVTGTGPDNFAGLIECSIDLARGHILFNGSIAAGDLATGAVVPVVGGTGAYEGAGGVVTIVAPDHKHAALTFDLVLPKGVA
jgi:hypothetical protein